MNDMFKVGDRVVYHPALRGVPSYLRGIYVVRRELPVESGQPTYQIESVKDGHNRVAIAYELAQVSPTK
jgi:hypothetical protein